MLRKHWEFVQSGGDLVMWPKLAANPIPEQQWEWGEGANRAGNLTSCMLSAGSCVPPHTASPGRLPGLCLSHRTMQWFRLEKTFIVIKSSLFPALPGPC